MIFLEMLPPAGVRFFLSIYFVIQSGMDAFQSLIQPLKTLIHDQQH